MSTILAAAFVLVTIAQGGTVSSSYYQSMNACEDAKSVSTTGETIEQREQESLDRQRARDALALAHPLQWSGSMAPRFNDLPENGVFMISGDARVVQSGDIRLAACFEDKGDKL